MTEGTRRTGNPDRGWKDPSTDSVDLKAFVESGRTAPQNTLTQGLPDVTAGIPVDANVILIAHPEGKLLGMRFRLAAGGRLEIGRSPAAEVSLPEVLSVSRNHARLEYGGGEVTIEDLGSTNGTYVNGALVEGRRELHSGDRFQVGGVHFKFLHERDVEHAYHDAIYNLMMRDGLTDVFNKRKYQEESEREVARALRYGRPLALVLFDLDHFKAVNDTYGHLCGDAVLRQLCDVVREAIRGEQVLARVGGEEFAVLCPETTLDGAQVLAEKLRERVAASRFEYVRCDLRVTCSFGVAALGPQHATADALYDRADRALYLSKQNGRNRVTVAAPPAV